MRKIQRLLLLILSSMVLITCAVEDGVDGINGIDGRDGRDGNDGLNGSNGVSVGMYSEVIDDLCTLLTFFVDTNSNGQFDNETIIDSFQVCSGTSGENGKDGASIGLSIQNADEFVCPNAGYVYTFYLDSNYNNTLDESENVLVSTPICNGLDGIPVGVDVLPANGEVCETGGWEVIVFMDENGNGFRDAEEEIVSSKTNCFPEEIDDDNDGVPNSFDNCPLTQQGSEVNAFGCASYQLDSDNDGVSDEIDQCPNTPEGTSVNPQGCNLEEYNAIEYLFSSVLVNNISFEDASISVNVEQSKGETQSINEVGFQYGEGGDLNLEIQGVLSGTTISLESFSEALKFNTTYSLRPYLKNSLGTYYGSISQITTLNSSYNFSNTVASNIEFTTASISAEFQHVNSELVEILEKGFYLSTSLSNLRSNARVYSGNGLTLDLSGLSTGTKWYFQAYVKNKYGESTSPVSSFTTKDDTPSFAFSSVSSTVSSITSSFLVKAKTTPLDIELEVRDDNGNIRVVDYSGLELSNTTNTNGAIISFEINDLIPNSRYDYVVRLTSQYGTYESTIYGFSTKSDIPTTSIEVSLSGDNQMTVNTLANGAVGADLIRVYLAYKHLEESSYNFIELSGGEETTVLNDLVQGPEYEFKLVVQNNFNTFSFPKYSSLPVTYSVGDELFGGIIVYIDASGYHGIVAARLEEIRLLSWNNDATYPINFELNLNNGFDNGQYNTGLIVNFYSTSLVRAEAAEYCNEFKGGGYNDWYLPSIQELSFNNSIIQGTMSSIYGSTFRISYNTLWTSNFELSNDGVPQPYSKSYSCSTAICRSTRNSTSVYGVLPIRKF